MSAQNDNCPGWRDKPRELKKIIPLIYIWLRYQIYECYRPNLLNHKSSTKLWPLTKHILFLIISIDSHFIYQLHKKITLLVFQNGQDDTRIFFKKTLNKLDEWVWTKLKIPVTLVKNHNTLRLHINFKDSNPNSTRNGI